MLLDTARSNRGDDETQGARLRTPPGASQIVPDDAHTPLIRRALLADVSCSKALIERFGRESDAFIIEPIDLLAHLANPRASPFNRAVAVVMAPVLSNGASAVGVIERLRALYPHVGMYVVANETAAVSRTLPKFAAVGVDEVFCFAVPSDIDTFEDTLSVRLSVPPPETELRLLWKWFRESPERSLVMHCVRNGFRLDIWSIRTKVFSQCRKTLQNRLGSLGVPSPGILARCGRSLHAYELERRGVKPAAAVAATLGYPSAGAMLRGRRRLQKVLMSRGAKGVVFASLLR